MAGVGAAGVASGGEMILKLHEDTGISPRVQMTTMAWCSTSLTAGGGVRKAAVGAPDVVSIRESIHDAQDRPTNATAMAIGSERSAEVSAATGVPRIGTTVGAKLWPMVDT